MQERTLPLLRCPVSRSPLQLEIISTVHRPFHTGEELVIHEGILYAEQDWFYPIIDGIPRLIVEAFLDYEDFFRQHLSDYAARRSKLEAGYTGLIGYVRKKNKKTKASFSREWGLHDYGKDRTWRLDTNGMLQTFLSEVDETADGLKGRTILDAGCGNGQLDTLIARQGATVIAMDLSRSIERAYQQNTDTNACYLQGDVQFPPLAFAFFDIVHSSGVLHHTNNTELSFSCLSPCVAPGGKLSVWLYRPRKNFLHQLFNRMRSFLSPLPSGWLYFLLRSTIFPISWLIKRMQGSRQNSREMMIEILDWFTPEFRWEHHSEEVKGWFAKRGFVSIKETTTDIFGFNMTGSCVISALR